jgi:hypothetical protein
MRTTGLRQEIATEEKRSGQWKISKEVTEARQVITLIDRLEAID